MRMRCNGYPSRAFGHVFGCTLSLVVLPSSPPDWSDRVLLMSPTSSQPSSDRTQPRKGEQDGKEDLFATLFSPPTPPASPLPIPVFDPTAATSSTKPQSSRHSRNFSTSSVEFGSFVSVPVTDDPLYTDQAVAFSPISPIRGLEFFDQFTDHAVKSNAQKSQVLDELLLHEDDPLYWLDDTSGPAPPDLDTLETRIKSLGLSHSPVSPIPEEPSSSVLEGEGRVPDRCVWASPKTERHLNLIAPTQSDPHRFQRIARAYNPVARNPCAQREQPSSRFNDRCASLSESNVRLLDFPLALLSPPAQSKVIFHRPHLRYRFLRPPWTVPPSPSGFRVFFSSVLADENSATTSPRANPRNPLRFPSIFALNRRPRV